MINRVLIRIKVVQILYSYLLVEKKFTLEDAPASPTKEKRFAYGLYLDMLDLIVTLSGMIERRRNEYLLSRTRFVERIQEDDRVRGMLARQRSEGSPLMEIASELADKIKESGVYKNYLKDLDKGVPTAEETFWPEAFNRIIAADPQVRKYAEGLENYTLKGFERMEEMMNGTLSNFMASQDSLAEGLKTLETSLEKARELYFRLLALSVDLTYMQERVLDSNRHKFLKSEEDLNPNMKFVENRAVAALRNDQMFQTYIDKNKISWTQEDPDLLHRLLKAITESDVYAEYMSSSESSLKEDAALWRELYRKVILVNSDLLEVLEEQSVFWNDDVDIIGTFVSKTFRRIEEEMSYPVLDKYKDDEDACFGRQLMTYVFRGKEQYGEWIRQTVADSNWDADRLAFMDVVILMTALAEIINFPKIPLTASINEYIEIAKSYSSSKSGQFVNGLLASMLPVLREKGIVLKR